MDVEVLPGEVRLLEAARLGRLRVVGQVGVAVVLPGQEALTERAPRGDGDVPLARELQVVPLDLAVDEVVARLEHFERLPPLAAGDLVGAGDLPGVRAHRGGAEVVDLAGLDEPVERLHQLAGGRLVVPAVDVEDVDVIGVEPVEQGVDAVADVLAVRAAAVRVAVADLPVHLRGDRVALPVALGEPVADPALAVAAAVHVGGVDVATAGGLVGVEQLVGALLVDLHVPRLGHAAEPPRAELEFARPQAGSAERHGSQVDLVELGRHRRTVVAVDAKTYTNRMRCVNASRSSRVRRRWRASLGSRDGHSGVAALAGVETVTRTPRRSVPRSRPRCTPGSRRRGSSRASRR